MDCLTYAGNLENLKDIEDKENYTFIKADIDVYKRQEQGYEVIEGVKRSRGKESILPVCLLYTSQI